MCDVLQLMCFRYIFRNAQRVGMQELGPRFTLKLRSLQKGTFDSKYGDYVWTHNVSCSGGNSCQMQQLRGGGGQILVNRGGGFT